MAASSKRYWGVALLIGLALLTLRPHPAQGQTDQQASFRLSRLETAARSLQSQISQLDSQIGRLQRLGGAEEREAVVTPRPGLGQDYDQLATLVIETRQDVFSLQEDLARLKAQLGAAGGAR